jgi:protein-tyrosine phosphatase
MVDIHSHILPELDDGAKSLDESIRMLEIAAEAGTTDIVGSPHSNAEFPFRPDLIQEKVAALRSALKDRIRIHSGCDFHLSYDNIQDALSHPDKYTINNRCYLLVEFSDASIFQRTVDIFGKLLAAGMIPIITHPERNALLQRRFSDLQQWVQDGCMVQVTAQSFLGVFGRSAKQYADLLLEKNLVHFVASDAHDCEHRPPKLDESYAYVARKVSPECADRIFREYPQCVIDGDPIYPEEYVETKRKWFHFWS